MKLIGSNEGENRQFLNNALPTSALRLTARGSPLPRGLRFARETAHFGSTEECFHREPIDHRAGSNQGRGFCTLDARMQPRTVRTEDHFSGSGHFSFLSCLGATNEFFIFPISSRNAMHAGKARSSERRQKVADLL